MYGYGTFYNFLDPTFLLVIAGLVISGLASLMLIRPFENMMNSAAAKVLLGPKRLNIFCVVKGSMM